MAQKIIYDAIIVGSGAAGSIAAHDVKNLFVVDGAAFVSGSEKNCTLTIAALSWRASEYLVEELRKGNLG